MFKSFACALLGALAAAADSDEFSSSEYLAQTRQEKQEQIWDAVTEDTSLGNWHLAQILTANPKWAFDTEGDAMRCTTTCRKKTTHANGMVAKAEWVSVGDHPYTGMFKGADTGFVRMSSAAPQDPSIPQFIPGMGVKMLRDGVDSANFGCMWTIDGQTSMNYFAHDFSTHLPAIVDPKLKPLEMSFVRESMTAQVLGLSEFSEITQEGVAEENPQFPWKIRLAVTGEFMFPDDSQDFLADLATIPAGSTLYDIYAWDKPEELGGTETLIAHLNTVSELTTSNWGDEHMQIRHQRVEEDLVYHPEWEPYVPKYQGPLSLGEPQPGCPFYELLQYLQ